MRRPSASASARSSSDGSGGQTRPCLAQASRNRASRRRIVSNSLRRQSASCTRTDADGGRREKDPVGTPSLATRLGDDRFAFGAPPVGAGTGKSSLLIEQLPEEGARSRSNGQNRHAGGSQDQRAPGGKSPEKVSLLLGRTTVRAARIAAGLFRSSRISLRSSVTSTSPTW